MLNRVNSLKKYIFFGYSFVIAIQKLKNVSYWPYISQSKSLRPLLNFASVYFVLNCKQGSINKTGARLINKSNKYIYINSNN